MSSHNFINQQPINTRENTKLYTRENTKITRINIDSMHRNKESKNIIDMQVFRLEPNPITIINNTINDSEMIIKHENHTFKPGDNIVIQGTQSISINLANALTFIANSSYVRIEHKSHGLDFSSINDIYINISGFIGNTNNNTQYHNIFINKINNLHKIYFKKSDKEIRNNDYYYINMENAVSNFSNVYDLASINIVFSGLNGINLNLINANYPLSIDQLQGYHIVTSVSTNTFTIALEIQNNINVYNVGGNNMWTAKILDFIEGYEHINYYKIPFKKTFNNITKIKLISTEFPNTETIVRTVPESKKNNMFYWKLESDGSTIYSVELDVGNYSIKLLETNLVAKIEALYRDTVRIINKNNKIFSYHEYNQCSIVIEPRVGLTTINFYSTIYYPKAIVYKSNLSFTDNIGRIILTHPDHHLMIDSEVTIFEAIDTDGIPADILNRTYKIEKVLDENTYQIKLPKYNVAYNTDTTNGGESMSIKYPIKSSILMDRQDTIGKLIGYRNVGKSNSISKYNFTNTNRDIYQQDVIIDDQYTNNAINLSGNNYILMTSPLFDDSYSSGNTTNIFAKLLLSDNPGSVLYNQYCQLGEYFDPPLKNISEWEVAFYDVDNELCNFGNINHSYTLEIHEELIK